MKAIGKALRQTPRLVFLAAGFLCALLIVMGTTFAWLVSSDVKTSPMGVMQYQFDAALTGTPPAVPAVRGGVIPNRAGVKNTGDVPAFVRVMVFPTLVAADGVTLLEMRLGKQVALGAPGPHWAEGGDGYYYYLALLAPGGTTDPLFENTALAADIAAGQTGAKLHLALIVESVSGTGDFYRIAWWNGMVPPPAAPLGPVDEALQTALEGN